MTEQHNDSIEQQSVSKKKQYKKPSFRKDQVFETMALSCNTKAPGGGGECNVAGKS